MTEEIEMGEDAKEALVEIDENLKVEDGVQVQIAKTNPIIHKEVPDKGVDWDAKSTPKKIFENHQFIGVRHGEGLTGGRAPSGSLVVRENSRLHQAVELDLTHGGGHPRLVAARLL